MPAPPKAIIFDIYHTLLAVGAEQPDENAFAELCAKHPAIGQPPALQEILATCDRLTRAEHARARALGIAHPEIQWSRLFEQALPAVATLEPPERVRFEMEFMACLRPVRRMDGAKELLAELKTMRLPLGIASNAQAYTPAEMEACGIRSEAFDPDLRFWSFRHGFSKPDPHGFRILEARLEARGIAPAEILMVGDRADNDIKPARRAGWQTWHVPKSGDTPLTPAGTLRECMDWIRR